MKKNLGQLLIEKGLVTEKILAEGLQRQVIFGGRLGTNLLEMGAITEDALMKLLALQFNVAYAEPQHFEKIPRPVLDSVPKKLLEMYRIVPIALDGKRITLAMTDPHKLDIVDEVAFQTNMIIQPVIASELRIVQALEKYYSIRREARYIAVSQDVAAEQKRMSASGQAPAPVPAVPDSAEAEFAEAELVEAELVELVELTEEDMEPFDPLDITGINDAFFGIHNRDDVAQTLIRAGLRFMDDAFLFIIKGDEALGWMSGGSAKPVVDFGSMALPVNFQNVLFNIRESRTLERFRGVDLFESNPWLKELSMKVPGEVVICPLLLKKHTVSVIVGFKFTSGITEEEAAFLVRVMQKASVAFEILILKSRILML
ncbi:MAG: hypothetical protein P1S46_10745 [bacterium]|nr:hypothetical protein [bacterium]